MKYSKQYQGYAPKEFFYGFIGKNFPITNHWYSKPEDLKQNKKILSEEIGISPDSFCFLEQIHSNKCFVVQTRESISTKNEGDALATHLKNVALIVLTADCVPVLFFDSKKKNVAIAHAGWKGAISGVIENTIKTMTNLGSVAQDIDVIIGPCIQQENYEVSADFYKDFISKNPIYKSFFIPSKKQEHFMFDLPGFVIGILKTNHIKKIAYLGENTYNSKEWFSYREDTHMNNKVRSGHILSFIGIK
jgi:YfiH family protein